VNEKHRQEIERLARDCVKRLKYEFPNLLLEVSEQLLIRVFARDIFGVLNLTYLLSARDERDELKNQLQTESWRASATEKMCDQLRTELAEVKQSNIEHQRIEALKNALEYEQRKVE